MAEIFPEAPKKLGNVGPRNFQVTCLCLLQLVASIAVVEQEDGK